MGWREKLAQIIAPEMKTVAEIRTMITDEIQRAKMAVPITANYDPKNEGYRSLSDTIMRRDLMPVQQSRMFEIAYYMYDASTMLRRLAVMDKSFMFSGPITITSKEPQVTEILDRFWKDPENQMSLKYPDKAMWLSLLGEQCWPVTVNPINGFVRLNYVDPALIQEVYVNPLNVEQVMRVDVMGSTGRPGPKYAAIRKDYNINSKTYDRLVGDCFFLAINHPPNSPRGRSDFLTLFDWIDAVERYGFNYLERAEFLLNFVWDVVLKGMDENEIRNWIKDNPPPSPGSLRAHNENVEWNAVAPDIKAQDFRSGFEMGKSIVMGGAGRPDSWFGGGGKAYQTEAEQFGQVPIADLDERQRYHKHYIEFILAFVIDQAIIAGMITPEKASAGCDVSMPEVSKKDLTKMINGVPQLATALAIAVTNDWISKDTATRVFAFICSYLGFEINAQEEIDNAATKLRNDETDYEDLLKNKP